MNTYLARVNLGQPKGIVWIMFDAQHTLRGKPKQTRRSVMIEWKAAHGLPPGSVTRISGIMRLSEFVMELADVQHPREERKCE